MCPVSGCEALTEWEYLPPVGPRPTKGFVGLKNAGATCYMNSVIQQLYMIPPIRNGLLAIDGTGSDIDDDLSGDEKQDNEVKHTHVSLDHTVTPYLGLGIKNQFQFQNRILDVKIIISIPVCAAFLIIHSTDSFKNTV